VPTIEATAANPQQRDYQAQRSLKSLFTQVGLALEPTKSVPPSHSSIFLGVKGGEVPRQNLTALSKGEQWAIKQLELLALVTAVTTFPELFKDRDCLVYVDNVSCFRATVHGAAKVEDMSEMANALHISLARLRVNAVFLHVPGLANPADIPSRIPFIPDGDTFKLDPDRLEPEDKPCAAFLSNAVWRALVVPTPATLADLGSFFDTHCVSYCIRAGGMR